MRNDLLAAAGVLVALLIGYWLFHGGTGRNLLSRASSSFGSADVLMRDDFIKAASSIKVAVAEFYVSRGRMPSDNAEAGLPAPDAYRGETLKSATVRGDGAIELVFDARSGREDGMVRLVADTTHADAMGVQWTCETSDYPKISRMLANCTYVGQ